MTIHEKILTKGFIVFMFLLLLGIAITVYTQTRTLTPAKAAPIPTISVLTETVETEVDSAKADQKLRLRATPGKDGTTTYTFTITDGNGNNPRLLLAKTLGPGSVMSIPWNAWDPTDTYVFVEEKDAGVANYYVFQANGNAFASGDRFIDVGSVWGSRNIGLTIREATGWASGTLLIIYTSKDDGSKGSPYWFEIPSTATIQLAG